MEIDAAWSYGGYMDVQWMSCSVCELENKWWKPNAQEVLDGFILHIKVNNDLAPSIERIILRAQRMKYKVQPIIIAVGATLAECKDFYVVIDKNYYHFNDCKTAVDVCYKQFMHFMHIIHHRMKQFGIFSNMIFIN